MPAQISKPALYGIMTGMLLCGTANTLIQKAQDQTEALGKEFTHPYLQTAVMFGGEFSCIIIFIIKRHMDNKKKAEGQDIMLSPGGVAAQQVKQKTNINPLLIAIPATCDFCGSTLMFIALTMVPASIYQMMRGIIVVITALLAMIFLGRKQYRHHWTAIVLIIAGVFEVGYVAIAQGGDDPVNDDEKIGFGILLLLISQLFAGTMFIVEEKLLGDYYLDPFQVVGTEGMWGLCYYLALLPIMQLIKCNGALCNFNYFENSAFAFAQYADNPWLIVESLGIMVSIACFNCFGIATTKYASAAQRSTIDTSRTLLIWIFSCLFLGEPFYWQSIIGFVLLVIGTLMYNEILVIPYLGFDQNTKEAIAKRAKENGEEATDGQYTSLSPHAAYDSKRNQRGVAAKTGGTRKQLGSAEGAEDEYMLKEGEQ